MDYSIVMAEGRAFLHSEAECLKLELKGGQRRFKWMSDVDKLKTLFSEVFNVTDPWYFVDNFGGYHRLKTKQLVVTYFTSTNTLQIQGPHERKIKTEIIRAINGSSAQTDGESVEPQYKDFNDQDDVSEEDDDCEIHEANDNNENLTSGDQSKNTTSAGNGCKCCSKMDEIVTKFEYKIEDLEDRLTNLNHQQIYEISNLSTHEMPLKDENQVLKAKVASLQDELEKVKEENKALLTTLRLFNNASKLKETEEVLITKITTNTQSQQTSNLHMPSTKQVSREIPKAIGPTQTTNNLITDQQTEKTNRPKHPANRRKDQQTKESNTTQPRQPTIKKKVFLVGDSIVKNLQGRKMSNKISNVHVLSIPGCKSHDMRYHVQPILNSNPDEIIVHVGTNSLASTSTAQECAEEIAHVASLINTNKTQATISSILPRDDRVDLNTKLTSVNQILEEMCLKNKWNFIKHDNILTNHHFNRSKLHLNKKGTSQLASNFIKHLKNN